MDIWVQDWGYAKMRTQETGRPAPHAKKMADLVPGDRYVHLGDEFEVLWWAREIEPHVWTMLVEWSGTTRDWIRVNPEQDVAAWKGRDVNYGTGRCGHCMCFVRRDHAPGSEECRRAGQERRESQSDWGVAWD